MKKTIIALALAAGLTSFAGSAKAAVLVDFNFSTTGPYSNGSGFTGKVFGLTAGASSQPSNIEIFTVNGTTYNFFMPQPDLVNSAGGYITVSDDGSKVTEENYYSVFGWGGIYLGGNGYNSIFGGAPFVNGYSENRAGLAGIVFTPATVPEPSTYALFGIGAIGMLMVMRRKVVDVLFRNPKQNNPKQ